MLHRFFSLNENQKGFTLVELLVAVAITAVIGSVLGMSISQLFSVSIASKNRMEAVKQVENALHYINRDAQMAKAGDITLTDGSSVLLTNGLHLHWTDYNVSPAEDNQVEYRLNANGDLLRIHNIDGTIIVGHHIDLASNYTFNGEVLTVTLAASVEGFKSATEARTLDVKPRVS